MQSKQNEGGWLACLELPCQLRRKTALKLTASACLFMLWCMLLFNRSNNLALLGEIRQGGEQAQDTPGRTLPVQPLYHNYSQHEVQTLSGTQAKQSRTGLADDFRACLPRPIKPQNQSIFLDGFFTFDDKLTVKSCISTCSIKKFPLAALGAGTECHCGAFSPEYRMQKVLPFGDCNIPCGGDVKYYCGGDGAVSLYQTAAEDTRCNGKIIMKPVGTLPLVALASFPGSGNTWVRYLIERATGIYTGSIYNDKDLFNKGFKGELKDWRKGTTIAVKTHNPDPKRISEYKAVILIIRNPYNAIIAEHNRQFGGGHVGVAPESKRKGKAWTRFVKELSARWKLVANNYINSQQMLHIVYYEDLQTNLYENLKMMVKFLNVPVNEDRLLCVLSNPVGKCRRSKKPTSSSTFDPFTEEMKEMINLNIKHVSMTLESRNYTGLPKDYSHRT
ncbi:sialate:O-sulfotransferase 2-like isoform X2 [Asterias amurensis]|uniref:sialate:O-sulfotransferase 2-like isoform X2 n=1 Tax=Asterias amurensis TaxID=7602 RepID=UPI003AB1AE53